MVGFWLEASNRYVGPGPRLLPVREAFGQRIGQPCGPDRGGRYATILIGPEAHPLELTVMSLGGSLLENVNRWRDQVGLPPVKNEELGTASREVTTKQGKKITRVDASGMASKGAQMPPFMKGR